MATIALSAMEQVASHYGAVPTPRTYPEGATQTFVEGEVVVMSAGYLIEIASDTPAALIGVAAEDSHNDATAGTHSVSVNFASEGTLFSANMKTTALASYVSLAADQGRVMGISRDTTNSVVVLNAAIVGGTSAYVFVHGVDTSDSAIGDTNARMIFEWLAGRVQFRSTS